MTFSLYLVCDNGKNCFVNESNSKFIKSLRVLMTYLWQIFSKVHRYRTHNIGETTPFMRRNLFIGNISFIFSRTSHGEKNTQLKLFGGNCMLTIIISLWNNGDFHFDYYERNYWNYFLVHLLCGYRSLMLSFPSIYKNSVSVVEKSIW